MDNTPFLKQIERELDMANRSIAFWRGQLAQHRGDRFIIPIAERSLEAALATMEHLEQTKKAVRGAQGA